jgi:uncharacterized protein YjbJ (UPF0337 family)
MSVKQKYVSGQAAQASRSVQGMGPVSDKENSASGQADQASGSVQGMGLESETRTRPFERAQAEAQECPAQCYV